MWPPTKLSTSVSEVSAQMQGGMLIAYASKSGWTAEVAEMLGQCLAAKGEVLDVLAVEAVSGLDGYRAVVVGSAVRVGKWLPQATDFIARHRERLGEIPTAIFTVHMLGLDDSAESRERRRSYTAPVREMITPVAEAFFAGGIAPARLSFFERLMTRAVKAPVGDFRDPRAISAWAEELHGAFGQAQG